LFTTDKAVKLKPKYGMVRSSSQSRILVSFVNSREKSLLTVVYCF